ncbi:hypothetical protein [Tateyamaria sp. ANG-S1]|uniref:hypothetical protein n=1 Tax=Tateyamaria sp. ANG-S1 TaxID=1577905 RepID=UPI001269AA9F|nr:hypothetical protein [Tateyamaria sp. ANG-S1]
MDTISTIEYSPGALEDFCGLFRIPVDQTEENPELAFHCLNGLWGVPIIDGPQSARRPTLNALGRAVDEGFRYSISQPFKYSFGTLMGQMQAWPVLFEYVRNLLAMSEAELLSHYDDVKQFFDRHAGIASGLGAVGTVGALRGQTPAQIAQSIGQRAAAMGDAVDAAAMERVRRTIGERFPRANTAMNRVGSTLTGTAAGAFGILAGVVYVATIGEAADKLAEIRAVATIKYSNNELSERTLVHILDLAPTDALPERYFDQ